VNAAPGVRLTVAPSTSSLTLPDADAEPAATATVTFVRVPLGTVALDSLMWNTGLTLTMSTALDPVPPPEKVAVSGCLPAVSAVPDTVNVALPPLTALVPRNVPPDRRTTEPDV